MFLINLKYYTIDSDQVVVKLGLIEAKRRIYSFDINKAEKKKISSVATGLSLSVP